MIGKVKYCRGCGEEIFTIKTGGIYGSVPVESEPVWIRPETGGEMFFTITGRMVYGYEVGDAEDSITEKLIPVHRPHKGRCPNNMRAPRNRGRI